MNIDELDSMCYSLYRLGNAARECGISVKQMELAFTQIANIENIAIIKEKINKEERKMELKLFLMEARLVTLEGRSTECEAIRKKLRRQIRNLKAAMSV